MAKKFERFHADHAPRMAPPGEHQLGMAPAMERVIGWIRGKHEPSETEICEVIEALYRPLPLILLQLKQITLELHDMTSKFASVSDAVAGLTADVEAQGTVLASAKALINSIPALIQAGIADALSKGATPEQLQSLSDASDAIESGDTDLLGAVTANTPAPPAATDPFTPAPTPDPAATAKAKG